MSTTYHNNKNEDANPASEDSAMNTATATTGATSSPPASTEDGTASTMNTTALLAPPSSSTSLAAAVASAAVSASTSNSNSSNPLKDAITNYFLSPSAEAPSDEPNDELDNQTNNEPSIDVTNKSSNPYFIDQVFKNPYWKLPSRFVTTSVKGILYRPGIVNDICAIIEQVLSHKFVVEGVMIKGPQGVGKSHSIVNVVRKLQSTGKYLVTFIPDCAMWDTSFDLINAICSSFGTSYDVLDLKYFRQGNAYVDEIEFPNFIKAIDTILEENNKQWVFVFDQINRLFARFPDKKDLGVLPFPFKLITKVMSAGRITSIISASANNEISYKERHPGFIEYIHPTDMTIKELQKIYQNTSDFEEQLTGHVPLYVDILLQKSQSREQFISRVENQVEFSHGTLLNQNVQPLIISQLKKNICQILLGFTFKGQLLYYDKKHFVEKFDGTLQTWTYKPLTSLVEDATRVFFWDELMTYIAKNEVSLLNVMNATDTTNDTRGRIFEGIVVQRCRVHGVIVTSLKGIQKNSITIGEKVIDFKGSTLQEIENACVDTGVFVPKNCNFPAVDMVWKSEKCIYGVQIHVSSNHNDVAAMFWDMCDKVSWFDKYKVYLLYLSPNENCAIRLKTSSFCKNEGSKTRPCTRSDATKEISIGYITIQSVQCLKDLPVPIFRK